MAYEILITGGTVIDGTGKPKFEADIGVNGGKVKDVGRLGGSKAEITVSATGKFVAPAFIDITSHSDSNGSLFQESSQAASLTQGVATIVVGNCGVSLAPLVSTEAVHALQKWQDVSSQNVNWRGVGEFLDELSRHKLGVNVATLVGHNTLRRGIIGNEARPLSAEEAGKMQYLIEKSISEGAFGFSTALVNSHEMVAPIEELIFFLRSLAKSGGIYKTHLRNESKGFLASVNEAIRLGRESGAVVAISHIKAVGRKAWPFFPKAIKMIDRAREGGAAIYYDMFPYERTGSFLYQMLPAWTRKGGFQEMLTRFRDSQERQKILAYLKPETFRFERIIVASAPNSSINGKSIQEVADLSGRSAEETFLDVLLESGGRATIFGGTLSSKNVSLGITAPFAAVASDGGGVSAEFIKSGKLAHPVHLGRLRTFCTASCAIRDCYLGKRRSGK